MANEVIMPALGMAQETGRLVAWVKKEGEHVEKGDILMEVETDKTTVEVEATASGTLVNVTAEEGTDIPVGTVIALIVAEGEAPPPRTNGVEKPAAASADGKAAKAPPVAATPVATRMADDLGIDLTLVTTQGKRITRADIEAYMDGRRPVVSGRVLASPKARRLARERGIQLAAIAGTGPDGAVLADDVTRYTVPAAQPTPTPSPDTPAQTGTMWRRMAERLTESWQTVPHFFLKRDVSMEAVIAWRESLKRRSDGKITYTDLLVKLVAAALGQHPHVNGRWNGEAVVFNDQINVGLAVAVDEGLIVPVIHDADMLGVTAIAERRAQIVERAQMGRLQPVDLQEGTFTISNLGMFGIDEFSAIVNPPQAAILAVGSINERVVPVDGQAVIRPMMTLSLSCDHRAVDGARGARFLDTLVQLIQDPLTVLD